MACHPRTLSRQSTATPTPSKKKLRFLLQSGQNERPYSPSETSAIYIQGLQNTMTIFIHTYYKRKIANSLVCSCTQNQNILLFYLKSKQEPKITRYLQCIYHNEEKKKNNKWGKIDFGKNGEYLTGYKSKFEKLPICCIHKTRTGYL